jgi:hypothetical protein
MSTVRAPARLWISIVVAATATCLSLLAGVSLIIAIALWIGVVFDWYSPTDFAVPARPKRVPPEPARASWIPAPNDQTL